MARQARPRGDARTDVLPELAARVLRVDVDLAPLAEDGEEAERGFHGVPYGGRFGQRYHVGGDAGKGFLAGRALVRFRA